VKKNNKTYVLLAVVISIWGIIGYKFISTINPAPKEIVQTTSDKIFTPQQLKKRTVFSITANYRDPFLGTVSTPPKKVKKTTFKKAQKQVPKKSIQYTGFIGDTNSNENIFFVTVNGQQQMMSVNDTFQEVKLVRGTKSTIKVKYGGATRTIQLTE